MDRTRGNEAGPRDWRIVGGTGQAVQMLADPEAPHSHIDKLGQTVGSKADHVTQGSSAGKQSLKPLIENTCGGWGSSRRNSQPHRRGRWRDPQGPRACKSPPTWESAPEGPSLIEGNGGSG